MIERAPDDVRLTPIRLRRELLAAGVDDRTIRGLVRDGHLHRVRHGAYVDGEAWRACDERGRYGLLSRAALAQAKTPSALSHLSALAEWDVPFWDLALDEVHLTRLDRKAGRREAGVRQHLGELREGDVIEMNGVNVTAAARTVMDSLRVLDVEHGLTTVNDMLHRKIVTLEELQECSVFMRRWPETLGSEVLLARADSRIESVGESRTAHLCWDQGLPRAVPQFPIRRTDGTIIHRVDFAWPELGVFLEFDGKVKYQKYLKEGESVTDVVLREKKREELICRMTGWRCVRLTWAELYTPERSAAAIRDLFRLPIANAQ